MPDLNAYVKKAIALAIAPQNLAALRQNLRAQLGACDPRHSMPVARAILQKLRRCSLGRVDGFNQHQPARKTDDG